MPRHWYIKSRSGSTGPVTSKQLMRLAEKGKIQPGTGVSADGETWMQAQRISGLPFQPETPAKVYRIKTSRGIAGPFTLKKMLRLIEQGRLKPDVAVSKGGGTWHRAFRFEELPYAKPSLPKAPVENAFRELRREAYQVFGTEVRRQSFSGPKSSSRVGQGRAGEGSVDVCVYEGGENRPVTTIVTCGLSDWSLPDHDGPLSSRRELIFYVNRLRSAHVQLMGCLASAVAALEEPFGFGDTLSNRVPAKPIFRNSELDHFLFMISNVASDFSIRDQVSLAGEPLHLMWVLPITSAEDRLIQYQGIREFGELLDRFQHGLQMDPKRTCYVKRSMSIPNPLPPAFQPESAPISLGD